LANNDYKLHASYSFRGYHDNFIVGFLGTVDLYRPLEMTVNNLVKELNIKYGKY